MGQIDENEEMKDALASTDDDNGDEGDDYEKGQKNESYSQKSQVYGLDASMHSHKNESEIFRSTRPLQHSLNNYGSTSTKSNLNYITCKLAEVNTDRITVSKYYGKPWSNPTPNAQISKKWPGCTEKLPQENEKEKESSSERIIEETDADYSE